jgi:hypothetical protein
VDAVVEVFVWINERKKRIEVVLRKRAWSLPRASEQHHLDCAFPQLAPCQSIHEVSCPVCTLASDISPCLLFTLQSRPLSLAVSAEAGNEGYTAREHPGSCTHHQHQLYAWIASPTTCANVLLSCCSRFACDLRHQTVAPVTV